MTIEPYLVARKLRLEKLPDEQTGYPIEFVPGTGWQGLLKECAVPGHSWALGKPIYQLGLPENYLIVLIARDEEFILPNGSIELEAGDKILGLAGEDVHARVERLLGSSQKEKDLDET